MYWNDPSFSFLHHRALSHGVTASTMSLEERDKVVLILGPVVCLIFLVFVRNTGPNAFDYSL